MNNEQPPKKRRAGFSPKRSARAGIFAKVSLEVYYAILAEAKRTGVRTNDVAAAILRQWAADCALADRLRAQATKKPGG